ncbi:MAG: hypothetical protein ONA90_01170 [candidate division KSB1 bacterium]|nr:hypothetical protein [candidate division KSB1 bacterium]
MTHRISVVVALWLFFTVFLSWPQKKVQPKAPAKAAKAPPTKAAQTATEPPPARVQPAREEERQLEVPKPKSVKLPEAERSYENINQNPLRGTVTFSISGGIYNFNTRTVNPAQNITRDYSLQLDATTMIGAELAIRVGHDKEKDDDSGEGFHYYRSNRGIFTDLEVGFKTQRTEDKPSRFNLRQTQGNNTQNLPLDLGFDYTTEAFTLSVIPDAQRLAQAGISPQLRQAVGAKAFEGYMAYANTYYHLTPLNFILNWGSAFRWFDSSLGLSFRLWHYRDYSDPVRTAIRNDDWTRATFMLVYRQYIQFHPKVRLRSHFYFPALSYFAELARSPLFNEKEYILNTALEFYAYRTPTGGLILSAGYEGHWWFANPYSPDRFVRTGFNQDNNFTNQNYAGFEHRSRSSWEFFGVVAIEFHFDGKT